MAFGFGDVVPHGNGDLPNAIHVREIDAAIVSAVVLAVLNVEKEA